MRVVNLVGARPQFIKAAVVSRVLRATPGMDEVLIHTGQHYDSNMSAVFFEELEIPTPNYHLGIGSGSHGGQTGRMLEAVEGVLAEVEPDVVLVYGDTNSTLAGALAAVKLHIVVGHVEAGLRSFNRSMPEEINRVLTDHASDLLFAPTADAVENLRREGLIGHRVQLVGDVMYDAALYYGAKADGRAGVLRRLGLEPKQYVLATVHRAENTDHRARFAAIMQGLMAVAREVAVVLPVHPRARKALEATGLLERVESGLHMIEPVGYLDMIVLERNARLIATDSGGVQKEAFFHHVPCVTLREETEWVELVKLGWNHLVHCTTKDAVEEGIRRNLAAKPGLGGQPYGDGHAGRNIVEKVAALAAEMGRMSRTDCLDHMRESSAGC